MAAADGQLVLRFENNIEDIEEWVTAHYRRSPSTRRYIRRSQIQLILVALLALVLAPDLWFVGLLAVPAVALMPRMFFSQSRRSVRELYLEDGTPHGVGKHEVRVTPQGIEVIREKSRHFYAWSLVNKVVHGRNHTYVYVGSVSAIVIPHRNTDPLRREQLISRVRGALPVDAPHPGMRALPDGEV